MKETGQTYNFKFFFQDFLIGILIMLVSIPISMGYAMVAGLPAIYGLYGSVFPILIFGILSSSPRFVFGVDAAPAALVGGILASLEIVGGSRNAMEIIPVITLVTALWLLLFYVVSADKLLRFISQPVMGGFITGIGMTIILMQIPKLFGGYAGTGEMVELVLHIIEQAENGIHWLSLGLGVGTVVLIIVIRRIAPKIPMPAIMLFLGAAASYLFPLKELGVKMLPEVEAGLPELVLPNLLLLRDHLEEILAPSLTIAIVILSETLLTTNNLALKYDDKINSRREVLTYSFCNIAAAFTGCCPVNGSVSRTGIANQFGVKSQVMSIVAGLSMILVLLFGTKFIGYLPVPILTGIVIAALTGTFEFDLAGKLKHVDEIEYVIFHAAFLSVLLFGTIYGVIVGIILAAVTFIARQSRPATTLLGVSDVVQGFHSVKRIPYATPIKGAVIYRFTGSLFYANIGQFLDEVRGALKEDTRVVVIDMTGIGSVDVTAAERLLILYHRVRERGLQFYMTGRVSEVGDQLESFGAEELTSEDVMYVDIVAALQAAGMAAPYELEDENE